MAGQLHQPPRLQWQHNDLLLCVRVIPGAKQDMIGSMSEQGLQVRLRAAPVEGQANKALIALMAASFGVGKSAVVLISGETSRQKRLRISRPARLPAALADWPCPADGC